MKNNIRYVHTNIIARDWKKLSEFYVTVFGCEELPPERNLSGKWVDKLTNITNVNVHGIHLKLPGVENVTLEIFEYTPQADTKLIHKINSFGFGHLAFHVDDVEELVDKVIKNGGSVLGEIIKRDYGDLGILTAVYARDPEGNFIEIQNWDK